MNEASSAKTKKPIYKKWWFWVIAVFVLFGLGSLSDSPDGESTTRSSTASTPPAKTEAIKVSAVTLYNEYKANQVAADEKY